MIPWVKRLGFATFLSMALSISEANSREFSSKGYAKELLESIGGSTNGWSGLLVLLQERPNGPGPNRDRPENSVGNRPNNQGDHGQQGPSENRERQRQEEMQRQRVVEDSRRDQENREREVRERNIQRERFAQEAQNLERAMKDHQRALQEISARLEEIRKRMVENQGDPGPRKENQFFRPNPQQQGNEPFRGERRDPQLDEIFRRFEQQLDKQNAQIRGLEDQIRDLRNRDQWRQPGNLQHQGFLQNTPQIILVPFNAALMGQFGIQGPNFPNSGILPVPSGHGPNQIGPFVPNHAPQLAQPGISQQIAPNHSQAPPRQVYPHPVPNPMGPQTQQFNPPSGILPPTLPPPGMNPPRPPVNPVGPNQPHDHRS